MGWVFTISCRYRQEFSPLVAGWDIFCKGKQITNGILKLNKGPVDLLDQGHCQWYSTKTNAKHVFDKLDLKVGLGVATTQGQNWSEQCAMLINSFLYLLEEQSVELPYW